MELKDVTSMHIPAQAGAALGGAQQGAAFAEEFPESQRRYQMRAPGKRPYVAAAVVSAFWVGSAAAFAFGWLGLEGVMGLAWPWLAGLIFVALFPVTFVWFAAHLARRAQGLQLASEDLMQIAARLTEPEGHAGREITRLGRAVRREVDALNTGLEGALMRVRSLESAVSERLSAVEETARNLEERGDALRAALREERENLASVAHTLSADSDRMGEHLKQRATALRESARVTAAEMAAAQDAVDGRIAALGEALREAAQSAQSNAQLADRGAASLLAAAESLDGRLDTYLQRGERQRGALNEAVNALKAETQALETALGRNLDALGGIGQSLSEQTRRADQVASDIARRGEAASGFLGARADAIASAFAHQVDKLEGTAAAAEARLKAAGTAAELAAERVRTTFELASQGATQAAEQTGDAAASAMSAMSAALETLNQRTEEAREAASRALAELKAEAEALPALLAERIKSIRAEELAQLTAPPKMDALPAPEKSGAETSAADAPAPASETPGKPEWFGFARRLAGKIRREPEEGQGADWRLATALANVDDRDMPRPTTRPAPPPKQPVDLHLEALHVVEKLQALAIDLDRALGDDPAPDMWRRYINGERSVFTRRLVASIGRDGAERIAQRYAADTDFRHHADRYMTEFEGLLDDAASRDRDQILVETFLTSQTGRLYLLVAAATGRL